MKLLAVALERFARCVVVGSDDRGGIGVVGVDVQLVEAEVIEGLAVVVGKAAVEAARIG
ncbi:hypothetical protein AB0A73_10325 [Glycomyces sp. NPDC047369]